MFFNRAQSLQELTLHQTQGAPLARYTRQLTAIRNDQIPLHWHPEYQIVYLHSGQIAYQIGEEQIHLTNQKALFINSGVLHGTLPLTGNCFYTCIDFSERLFPEHLLPFLREELFSNEETPYKILQMTDEIECLLQSFTQEDLGIAKGIFTATHLLFSLVEHFLFAKKCEHQSNKNENHLIYQLLNVVHQNYQEPLTVEDLAAAVHINKNKCTQIFKKYTHFSPMNYVINYRLLKAQHLLLETEHSVSEICHLIGFNQLSYFIEKFKETYQFTPLQYRKKFIDQSS
ncbi:hypothetical protein IGI37_002625 [Enterococcus sp. AZ194]|uniref:helix-turn-helix transcriptional regulator n=1 Tax=Enterococcus sp. AZ194 TaxID=2774629 RepID=UPI003F2818C2